MTDYRDWSKDRGNRDVTTGAHWMHYCIQGAGSKELQAAQASTRKEMGHELVNIKRYISDKKKNMHLHYKYLQSLARTTSIHTQATGITS